MDLDERVRELLAGGDAAAAAVLVIEGLGPKILGYLRAVLRDEADAADAFSLWCEKIWRGIASFRGESSIRTWSFKIAWNASLNLRDDAFRRLGRPFATGEASRLAFEIRTATVDRVERQRGALAELRALLTAEEQTLLTLRIDQRLSWDEIAEVLSGDGARSTPPKDGPGGPSGPPPVPVESAALRKRFERLKDRLGQLARERGLVDS